MGLIFGQSIDKITVESPIIFGGIKSQGCPVRGRGILGVKSDFGPIDRKFSMEVEVDALNYYSKFVCNQLNSYLAPVCPKN